MKPTLDHIANEDLAAELVKRMARAGAVDWVAAYNDHDALRSDEAAIVEACSADTARRHATEAEDVGEPIGVLIAGSVWLISLNRLLADIERRKGRQERQLAEERAKTLLKSRAVAIGKFAATRARGTGAV